MSPVSWGDIFTLPLGGDKIMELRHPLRQRCTGRAACATVGRHDSPRSPVMKRFRSGVRFAPVSTPALCLLVLATVVWPRLAAAEEGKALTAETAVTLRSISDWSYFRTGTGWPLW